MSPLRPLTSVWTALLLWLASAAGVRVASTERARWEEARRDHAVETALPQSRVAHVAPPSAYAPAVRHAPPFAHGLAEPIARLGLADAVAPRLERDDAVRHRAERLAFPYDATAPPASAL